MSAPEIECPDCCGHGWRLMPGTLDDSGICPGCNGEGWREMTDDELDAAAEGQAEDAMSEPPMSLDEQHTRAWAQKQELRS